MKTALTDTFPEPNRRLLQRYGDLLHLLYLECLQRFQKMNVVIQIIVQIINTYCLFLVYVTACDTKHLDMALGSVIHDVNN